jgi:hypothetical protein
MTTPATEGIGGTPAADPPSEEGTGAPVTAADDGAESFADPPLSPLIEEPPRAGKRGRPRGSRNSKRKLKPREKRERKAKATKAAAVLDTELATAAAVAAADAAKDGKPSAPSASASDSEPARTKARPAELEAAAVLTDDDMVQIVGLGALGIARMIPEKFGGGMLSVEERELLGKAWWAYLRPYMAGEGGPLAVALGATVQVFALRWATAAMQPAAQVVRASNVAPIEDAPSVAPKADQVSGKPKSGARGAPQQRGLQAPPETVGRPPVAPDPS